MKIGKTMYYSRQIETYSLTKQEYNFLLPVMKKHLIARYNPKIKDSKYFYMGTPDQYKDARLRLEALKW